ncbi:MAG: hypothetical protein D6770_05405 [Anaerolineae bacterium]|nr:MAG: hypothetical protein D6770_05405 [Anaerolineae bacterium]
MAKPRISYGKCFFCEKPFAKNTILRHLRACPARKEAEASEKGETVRLFHLVVEGYHYPEYWMHIEIPASKTLLALDAFLRAVWVECCGHLSAFIIDNVSYELNTGMVDAMWKDFFGPSRPTRSMDVKLYTVLKVGQKFLYEYDFGTTTVLLLKLVGERQGILPKEEVRILARNYAPAFPCIKCGKPAEWFYVWASTFEPYCTGHMQRHKDSGEGFLPIVNSPRAGECGYTGPYDDRLVFEEHYVRPEKK